MNSTIARAPVLRQRRADARATAPVTLEAIAAAACVGIGTLYRHFPTREALVEAVYRNELAGLLASVDTLLAERPADAALRAWMDRFAGYVAAKRGMAETLRVVIGAGQIMSSETRDGLVGVISTLLAAGVADGSLRSDVRAEDVLASLTGIFLATGGPDQRAQAGRLLDLLMDGLRRSH